MTTLPALKRAAAGLPVLLLLGLLAEAGPVKVTVRDEKPKVVRASLPVDPTPRIRYQPSNLAVRVTTEKGQSLHLSHYPTVKVDNQAIQLTGGRPGGRFEKVNAPLPPGPGNKPRQGFQTIYHQDDLRITMTAELVPSRAVKGADKRRLDAVLMTYDIENKGKIPHAIGFRAFMDVYVVSNDGALFAAPNRPGKVLNGVELKGKDVPEYVQLLQRPNLQNPGYVAHLTLDLGGQTEKPDRVVLTSLGAIRNAWDMQAQPANGDSALGVFWEPKKVAPGGKRTIVYGYGGGVAEGADPDGRFEVQLGGNFEPGKLFTITALVHDPAPGQALTLELPAGMRRVEGKEIQPVPPPLDGQARSLVLWKGRALRLGEFPLRVRSNTGETRTKIIKIEPGE